MFQSSVSDCKNWLNGNCPYGRKCYFKHDPSKQNSEPTARYAIPSRQDTDCRYWLRGACKLGNKCWYRHDPNKQGEVLRDESTTGK